MESTVPVSGDTSNSNVRALSNVEAIDDSGENEHLHANNEVEHSQEDRNDKMGKNSPGNATIDSNRAKNLNFIGAFDKELENQVENKSRECNMQEQDDNSHEPLTLRYIDLRDHALKVVAEGATTAESYRFAMRGIQKLLQDVIANKLRTFTQNGGVQGDNTYKVSQPASINENVTLGDPQHTNKTGCPPTTNLNLGWENASKKRKTCVNCKQQGHDKRTCSRWTSNNAVAVPMSAIPEHELDPSSTVAFGGFQRFGFGA
ncbi:hypothetical protein AMTR_s00162p00075820 [Amborella trichopoda]|uniref:CCHC-type domain-containing protein n=1 Tax=Amborella trichopoda TaxID=13333 RepID=W1PMT4_AMBTC|nr:hypothetical protein AMTR_s00162p00075820 [Amborella trichopoda]